MKNKISNLIWAVGCLALSGLVWGAFKTLSQDESEAAAHGFPTSGRAKETSDADQLIDEDLMSAHDRQVVLASVNAKMGKKSGNTGKSDQAKDSAEGESQSRPLDNVLLNDPALMSKWGMLKTEANKAWEITKGSKEVKVCVIDTGMGLHKDLTDNLWTNPGESGMIDASSPLYAKCAKMKDPLTSKDCNRATNRVDDDKNGLVDDVHGANFVAMNGDLTDNHGHGTHINGIVGARGGDNFGITGVAPFVSLMVVKYYDPKVPNTNHLRNTINGIKYCTDKGANIINYSGGGLEFSQEEHDAIEAAGKKGILFVAAAGNEKSNTDEKGKHYYPADYELPNIISVTAVNKEENVLPSSNYGVRTVDIAAPGENIYSTLPNNSFGYMTGTSQATAFVTGVAVLVMAKNPEFTYKDVKRYILRTGDEYPTLLSKTGTAKLLNSYKAITSLDVGVAANGSIESNTSTLEKNTFSASPSARDSALAKFSSPDDNHAFAVFSKDLMKHVSPNDILSRPKIQAP